MFAPKKTLNNVESWKSASAYDTFILEKTKFVEYCIIPTDKTKHTKCLTEGITNLCLKIQNEENINPENAHKKKDAEIFVSIIISFINTASTAENINAKALYNTAFPLYKTFLCKKYVPNIINIIPNKA